MNLQYQLSKTLQKFQEAEEKEIMAIADDLDDADKHLVREFYEPTKITLDDLKRVHTPDEVRELCLRTKVRVKMKDLNCVWNAKKRLENKGRLKNRSERYINKLLTKAVMKKMVVPYTDAEILEANLIAKCRLKKDNNMRLDRWKAQRSAEQSKQVPAGPLLSNTYSEPQILNFDEWPNSQMVSIPNAQPVMTQNSIEALVADNPGVDWVQDALYMVNSASMSLNTESQPLEPSPDEYQQFNTQIPCTSTQSDDSDVGFL